MPSGTTSLAQAFAPGNSFLRSMARAPPRSLETPMTSSSAVRRPSPSSNISKSSSASLASKSIAASQILTSESSRMALNSSMSSFPSPEVSASSKSAFIFVVWTRMARCFSRTMTLSSVCATRKVSCISTPLITPITAKPIVSLWSKQKIIHHSLTLFTSSRQMGGQFAKVISNNDSRDRLKVPKYSYTSFCSFKVARFCPSK
mmetsp:Transcript_91477/g.218013  ORF Transcript_91477/g.218013 Transcript_91477/m.218013 type:complete len:203 (+) Transcript_91477:155-763(+)